MSTSVMVTCYRETKFGAAALNIGVEDFNKLDFEYGDSVDLKFSNGSVFENVPYFSGFFCKKDEIILTGNHWYHNVVACISQGGSLWDELKLQEGDRVEVVLRERGKYLDVQKALSMEYSNNREDYGSDVIFANFRMIKGGKLKKNMFYRGVSPCCDQCGRALYGEKMCRDTGIGCALNLCDDVEHTERFLKEHDLPYYEKLYKQGNVFAMGLTTDYAGYDFARVTGQGLVKMMEKNGPYYIHCLEGKDRTGFVCILLLALAGASVEEILKDYMKTYENYYGVTAKDEPEKYEAVIHVKANDLLRIVSGKKNIDEITGDDLVKGAEVYLMTGGLTREEVDKLRAFITE